MFGRSGNCPVPPALKNNTKKLVHFISNDISSIDCKTIKLFGTFTSDENDVVLVFTIPVTLRSGTKDKKCNEIHFKTIT
jgi:hypothetical protein